MEKIVWIWICLLWSIATFNIFLLVRILKNSQWKGNVDLMCASIYTLVCAFRSFFPRVDAERICFFDLVISYPFIGRSLATFAEISFAYQVSRFWFDQMTLSDQKSIFVKRIIRDVVFVSCTLAQVWCWLAVLTRNQIYHAIEESHWAGASALLTTSSIYFKWGKLDWKLMVTCIVGTLYTMFMIYVDIPMYLKKQTDIQLNVPAISISDGFSDSLSCRIVSQRTEDWIDEMAWLTGYFSFGVWSSLYIASIQTLKTKKSQ